MDFASLFARHRDRMDDFWGRRKNKPRVTLDVCVFGRSIQIRSNHQGVLTAVHLSLPLYSKAPALGLKPYSLQLVVQAGPDDNDMVPENLFDYIQYSGDAEWLMMRLGVWGFCYIDLAEKSAVAVLAPALAQRPDLVSLCLLNTVFTNFFIADGFGLLHASCLVNGGRALVLVAPHNSGKSTTALRLVRTGFQLLTDSMVFISPHHDALHLLGFPVGKLKLRQDVLVEFPTLRPFLTTEHLRGEIKFAVDLRSVDTGLVWEAAYEPSEIELCLLSRANETRLTPAKRSDALEGVMNNSLFYDEEAVWRRNLALLERLLQMSRIYTLSIGPNGEGLTAAFADRWAIEGN